MAEYILRLRGKIDLIIKKMDFMLHSINTVIFAIAGCVLMLLGFLLGNFYAISGVWIWVFIGIVLISATAGVGYLAYIYVRVQKMVSLFVDSADSLPHGVLIVNQSNKVVFKNKPFNLFFYPSIVDGGVNKRLAEIVKRARLAKSAQEILIFKSASGDKISFRVTASLINNYHGYIGVSVADVSGVVTDDSSELELHKLLDKAPVGVFSINSAGEFLYKNKFVDAWFGTGFKKNNLFRALDVADDRRALFPPAENMQLQKTYEHYFSVNKQFYRVFQNFVKNGNGDLVSSSILFKSKRNRQSVSLMSETFKDVFNHAPSGILLIDEKHNILEANYKIAKTLNKKVKYFTAKPLEHFLNFSCKKPVLEAISKVFQSKPLEKPVEISFKGVKDSDLAAYMSPLKEDGRVIACIVHLISTAEQKKMEFQFVHSQRMQAVGQLAGGVAHDFNNLLTAMIGFCDLLLQRHSPAEQSFSDIMQIKQNANRAAGLVRQLLAFSRQQSLQPKVINITDTLSDLSALLRRLLGPSIDLKVKHARDLWAIKVDKGQFEQVIINLAVNARDAMENKGVLKITTSNHNNKKNFVQNHDTMPPGEYVLIELEDTGSGIALDIIDRIFEPFFSTKAVGSGTGLGLSTVYGIVKQTGGFIFVDSILNKGTNFRIFLPRHIAKEIEDVQQYEDKALNDLTGTARILLVEDEDAVRMFAARALKDKGYDVVEAGDGLDAIDVAKENPDIDLIITDVVMPGMDGPQMINEIRQFMPSVQVVFISGYAEDSFRSKLNTEDNIHFLPKPFNLKDLALKVKDILS